ncbi:hypothetical protein BDW59DRAFT_176193 [Aspergillus cavernicola]|uniref:Zn(2)-C6 fungal-type domain-containing protein n=1 Tax=Aspergillus cavernicola TaxID=176166 RepID=A0ABR4HKJ8_9EURO
MQRYNAAFRMKLSLRCDRGEPECKRCQASGLQCAYPERRKVRGARQKTEIHHLGNRLEALEERLRATETPGVNDAPSSPAPNQSAALAETTPTTCESEQRTNTWIYRMVSGAKDSIETLTSKGHLIPDSPSPWAQSTVGHAITRLDTALVHLAAPSPRSANTLTDNPNVSLRASDIKRYIDTFLDIIVPHLTIFDCFTTVVDPEFLRAMPHIIDSPHARVNPVMRIIYYNAIYLGQSIGSEAEQKLSTKTYYKCLQSVPKWQESATGTQLDLLAASLTAWLAINNFDYHLSWQFHREACRFGDLLGIHEVDSLPPGDPQEESEKEVKRRLHWYLVEMDFHFRLWYDKPAALQGSMAQVRLPAEISPQTKQPKPFDSILFIVWSRTLFILGDYLESREALRDAELDRKIDHCCKQLGELVEDWDLLSLARSPKIGEFKSWLYAESIIAFHSSIIFMRRKASTTDQMVHPQAVHAARTTIGTILEWSGKSLGPSGDYQSCCTHLVTFYPFCAFFTLYNHIISSTDPSEYEDDICALEKVVNIMTQLASVRSDFVPIADALGALNDVSRAVHSGRDPAITLQPNTQPLPPQSEQVLYPTVQEFPPFESLQNLSSVLPLQTAEDVRGTFGIPFQLQNQIAFGSQLTVTAEPDLTRADTVRTVSQPLDFVRAIENELIWRNWHESWWNSQGDTT